VNSLVRRFVTGDGLRRSRLHDYDGNLIDARSLASAPMAIASTLRLKFFGRRPERPWISCRAQRCFVRLLSPESRVLEFGSGMSTLWFARRAGYVLSYETDAAWFEWLGRRVPANVDLRLVEGESLDTLVAVRRTFDLVVVDCETRRDVAMMFALDCVKSGGHVYLDNCDTPNDDRQLVPRRLERATADVRRFVDFYPTSITVSSGLLGRIEHAN